MVDSKSALREKIKLTLAALSESAAKEQEREIGKLLQALFHHLQHSGLIGGYAPKAGEVDWFSAVEQKLDEQMCFPAWSGEQMKFFRCSPGQLVESKEFESACWFPLPICELRRWCPLC